MKFPIYGIMAGMLLSCSGSGKNEQDENTIAVKQDLQEYYLKGKVESVLVETYEMRNNRVAELSQWNNAFKVSFDELGHMTGITEFLKYHFGHPNKTKYDTVQWKMSRDSAGYKNKLTGFGKNGDFKGEYIYVHDLKGNEIQTKVYGRDSQLIEAVSQLYNGENRLYMSKRIDAEGRLRSYLKFSYTPEGKVASSEEFNSHDISMSKTEKIYNKFGDIVQLTETHHKQAETIHYKYKYDSHGNYVERVTLIKGKPTEFEKRIISYYPDGI